MNEFQYKYIKRNYNTNLIFTDRKKVVYETETNDVYEKFH